MAPMTTRWNPFKTLPRFDPAPDFDNLFRGFGLRPMLREMDLSPEIRMDVNEDETFYRVKAEMPGVDKDDIEVSIDGNQVSISAEVKHDPEKKNGERELHSERYYGRIYRSFTLPTDVDAGKADARYDGGVLTLTLPKQPNGQSRRLAIR